MKTAGDLLHEKRLALELSLETVAYRTKVKEKYLHALEVSDFGSLPSSTVVKGFLKSYAKILHLNSETLIAMFRRDFSESRGEIIPRGLVEPINSKSHSFSVSHVLIIIAVLAFFTFLFYQLTSWWSLPQLEVLQPIEGEVYGEMVSIKGKTDPDATIRIGDQTVLVSQTGEFNLDLLYPAGTHRILIQSTSRSNKTRLLERTFTVSK